MKEIITLFLSNKEIKNIKSFYEEIGVDASTLFNFEGCSFCGRTYVDVFGQHETIIAKEDGIRIKGLGTFYIEDED